MSASTVEQLQNDKQKDGIGDRLCTLKHPSWWAQSEQQQMEELANEEFDILKGQRSRKIPRKGKQVMIFHILTLLLVIIIYNIQTADAAIQPGVAVLRTDSVCASFSQLRPFIYTSNGSEVEIQKYDRERPSSTFRFVRSFENIQGPNYLLVCYFYALSRSLKRTKLYLGEKCVCRIDKPPGK